MARLVVFLVLQVLGWIVLRSLWPGIRHDKRKWGLLALSVVALSGWVLPALLGRGMHGNVPFIGTPLKFFSAMWTVTVMLTVFAGTAWSLFTHLVGRIAGAPSAPKPDAAEGMDTVPEHIDVGRRRLLGNLGMAIPVAAATTSVAGVAGGSGAFTVKRETVRVKGLPKALDGFKIGQITDIHVGAFIGAVDVRRAVEVMNAEGTHLQVMTGDLIDDLEQLDDTFAALAASAAPHGMLAILGNHEHWRGLPPILEAYRATAEKGTKLKLLVDEVHLLEHEGAKVRVVGVDYPMLGSLMVPQSERMKQSAEVGFAGVQPDEFVLCLSHHPEFFPMAAAKGAHLTLSGHTHGGQVAFFGIPAFWFAFQHMLGRYRNGDRHLYVSGGTGHWLPFRIGVPTEVTILTLAAA